MYTVRSLNFRNLLCVYLPAITEDAHIRVKDLPPNATVALVESVFKQFGPIKKGRIRVINPANSVSVE